MSKMSKYISVQMEDRGILEVPSKKVFCKPIKTDSPFEKVFVSTIMDKYVKTEKNRINLENEKIIERKCSQMR